MIIEGKKIRLRPLRMDDLDHIMAWANDWEVTRTLLMGRYPLTRENEKEWLESKLKASSEETVFVIETRDGKYLGGINLFRIQPIDRHAELGLVIGSKKDWGKGYARESMELLIRYGFETLNLHAIYLGVVSFHDRAIKLYRSLGFVEEGRLRHRVFLEGSYHDMISMSLLRDDWSNRRKSS